MLTVHFSGIFNRLLCSAKMCEELRLAAPTLSVDVSFSKVEEPIALRQHFPETFLWLHITNLGYFTYNSSLLLLFSQHVVWLSVFFSLHRREILVVSNMLVVPDEPLLY